MRKLLFTFIAILVSYFQTSAQATLEITITNIREIKGSIRVGLFDTKKDFTDRPFVGKVATVSGNKLTVVFGNLKPGYYAISAFHDENDNNKLDTNAIGIPKEGFAFGNNAMGTFGPPSFKNAGVELENKPVTQVLILRYL